MLQLQIHLCSVQSLISSSPATLSGYRLSCARGWVAFLQQARDKRWKELSSCKGTAVIMWCTQWWEVWMCFLSSDPPLTSQTTENDTSSNPCDVIGYINCGRDVEADVDFLLIQVAQCEKSGLDKCIHSLTLLPSFVQCWHEVKPTLRIHRVSWQLSSDWWSPLEAKCFKAQMVWLKDQYTVDWPDW